MAATSVATTYDKSHALEDMTDSYRRGVLKELMVKFGTQVKVAEFLQINSTAITRMCAGYGLDKKLSTPVVRFQVVTKAGFPIGMLDDDGKIDGVECEELSWWLLEGRVSLRTIPHKAKES